MALPRRKCEFYLLKYVPDPVRNEFVHVGVLLREWTSPGVARAGGAISLRFTKDWRRVRCLDPDADIGMLEGLESELRRRFEREPEGNLMHVLEDSFSNSVQMTLGQGYEAESVETAVEDLMRRYVEPMKREKAAGRLAGRAAIHGKMRTEFERAGVWDLLRKRIAAAEYTRAGDPLRIDLGYRPNGIVRMFHAVSLEAGAASGLSSGVELAKNLAFSAAGLRAGVERVEKAGLELTVVVEGVRHGSGTSGRWTEDSEQPEWLMGYRFAVETMEEHGIRVLTTADLGRVAETARRELRV